MIGIGVLAAVAIVAIVLGLQTRHGGPRPTDSSPGSPPDDVVGQLGTHAALSQPGGTATSPTTALGQRLRELTDEGVLSADQASQLWQAAQQDQGTVGMGPGAATAILEPHVTEGRDVRPASSTGVLDVLGYVGGALLLGALIFVGFTLWGDLSRGEKTALAIASFVVPATGGVILEMTRTRRALARVLLALACFAAGFACYMIIDDQDLIISAVVIVVAAAIGAFTLRSAAFYLPAWVGAMGLVPAVVLNGLDLPEGDALGYAIAGGFLLVGLLLVAAGLLLGRDLGWALAGLSGWAASIPLVAFEHSYLALVVATVVAAALFVGVVRLQMYAFAVVGCLIVLSMWPVALYQILDTALGVALGLVAAGCVLIASAVVLARLRQRKRQPDLVS
jgi:hypothetical protein